MFSRIISNWWFTPDTTSHEYLIAQENLNTLFETLDIRARYSGTPERISETINELADEFLGRFDESPSNPHVLLDPFLMAGNCIHILSKPMAHAGTRERRSLQSKVSKLLHAYNHIFNTSVFTEQYDKSDDNKTKRDLAFAMISHERLGPIPWIGNSLDQDTICMICEQITRELKSQSEHRKFISDHKRHEYIDFVKSRMDLYERMCDETLVWALFRFEYHGTVY